MKMKERNVRLDLTHLQIIRILHEMRLELGRMQYFSLDFGRTKFFDCGSVSGCDYYISWGEYISKGNYISEGEDISEGCHLQHS